MAAPQTVTVAIPILLPGTTIAAAVAPAHLHRAVAAAALPR